MSAPPFVITIHKYLVCFVRIILNFLKGHGQSQPAIKDAILLESATSLAQKIRTKQVCSRFRNRHHYLCTTDELLKYIFCS